MFVMWTYLGLEEFDPKGRESVCSIKREEKTFVNCEGFSVCISVTYYYIVIREEMSGNIFWCPNW